MLYYILYIYIKIDPAIPINPQNLDPVGLLAL